MNLGNHFDPLLELAGGGIKRAFRNFFANKIDLQHRIVGCGRFLHDGLFGGGREFRPGATHRLAHIGQRRIEIRADREFNRNNRHMLGGGGVDFLNALHRLQVCFQWKHQKAPGIIGRNSLVGHSDHEQRDFDAGLAFNRNRHPRHDAERHNSQHHQKHGPVLAHRPIDKFVLHGLAPSCPHIASVSGIPESASHERRIIPGNSANLHRISRLRQHGAYWRTMRLVSTLQEKFKRIRERCGHPLEGPDLLAKQCRYPR